MTTAVSAVEVLQTTPTTVTTDPITVATDTIMNAVPSTSSMDISMVTSTPRDDSKKVQNKQLMNTWTPN